MLYYITLCSVILYFTISNFIIPLFCLFVRPREPCRLLASNTFALGSLVPGRSRSLPHVSSVDTLWTYFWKTLHCSPRRLPTWIWSIMLKCVAIRKHCPRVILCTALLTERPWKIFTSPNVATEIMPMPLFYLHLLPSSRKCFESKILKNFPPRGFVRKVREWNRPPPSRSFEPRLNEVLHQCTKSIFIM